MGKLDAFDRLLIASIAVALIAIVVMVHEGRMQLVPAPAATLTDGEYAAMRDQRLHHYARLQEKRESDWLRGQAIAAVITE